MDVWVNLSLAPALYQMKMAACPSVIASYQSRGTGSQQSDCGWSYGLSQQVSVLVGGTLLTSCWWTEQMSSLQAGFALRFRLRCITVLGPGSGGASLSQKGLEMLQTSALPAQVFSIIQTASL